MPRGHSGPLAGGVAEDTDEVAAHPRDPTHQNVQSRGERTEGISAQEPRADPGREEYSGGRIPSEVRPDVRERVVAPRTARRGREVRVVREDERSVRYHMPEELTRGLVVGREARGVVERARAHEQAIESLGKDGRVDVGDGERDPESPVQPVGRTDPRLRDVDAGHLHAVRVEQIREESLSTSDVEDRGPLGQAAGPDQARNVRRMQPSPILEIILIAILDVVMLGAIDVHTCEAPTPVIATPGADGAAAPGSARCESRSYSFGHPSGDRRPPA